MHLSLIVIHGFASVIGLLFITLFSTCPTSYFQKLLSLSTISSFIGILSYFFELCSTTKEEAFLANRFGYVGKSYAIIFFLIFISDYCGFPMNDKFKGILFGISTAVMLIVVTSPYHNLYYTSVEFVDNGYITHLEMGKSHLYYLVIISMIIFLISMVTIALFKVKADNLVERTRLRLICASSIPPALALVINMCPIAKGFDPTPLGILTGCALICLSVFKYGLLGTKQIAEEQIVDATNNGVVIVRENKRFIYANESAISVFPDLDDEEKRKEIIDELFKDIHGDCFETREYEKDGRIYEMNYSTLKSTTRRVASNVERRSGYMLWMFDKTKEYKRTRELMELREAAEKANRTKSMFLANTSHEIRTPMNSIIGFTNLALEEDNSEATNEYLNYIKNSGETLLHIINDILDLSKLEAGKFEIVEYDYSTDKLFAELEEIISPQAKAKNLKFKQDISSDIPKSLHGDYIRIKEILVNLLSNAVKYTKHGSVILSVRVNAVHDEDVELEIHVVDTGIGIKKEALHNIFDSFERSDREKNHDIEGTGLGLSIAKSLTSMMNGELSVSSEYGVGSDFVLKLTQKRSVDTEILVREEKVESYSVTSSTVTNRTFKVNGISVLIVDDNDVNLKVEKKIMEKYGMEVDTAISGEECMEYLTKKKYNLIFMDHMMPGMDGVDTLKTIREHKEYNDIPVVLVTANAIVGVEKEMLQFGFDGYISKPIAITVLEKELKKILPHESIEFEPQKRDSYEYEGNTENLISVKYILEQLLPFGVDIDRGINYCGDSNVYKEVLEIAAKGYPEKVSLLDEYLKNDDIKNYTILVHSLKSSCANIGATAVSEQAKKLEFAGKNDDVKYITDNAEKFKQDYIFVMKNIIDVLGISMEEPRDDFGLIHEKISDEEWAKYIDLIIFHLGELDDESASRVVAEMLMYELSDREVDILLNLKTKIDNYDFEKAKEMINSIKRN